MGGSDSGDMFYTKTQNSIEYRGTHFSSPARVKTYPKDINPHKKETYIWAYPIHHV